MNYFIHRIALFALFTMITGGILSSCESEPTPIELPSAESLILDLNQFPAMEQSTVKADFARNNWFYSAVTILSWNAVIAANIAIPLAVYMEADNYTPIYLGENQWEWNYSATLNQKTYTARLLGTRIDNKTFEMEMYISQGNSFTDFKWFEGLVRHDHTDVNWKISHSPDAPVQYLDVQFNKDFETDKTNIRYSVIDPDHTLSGSYIEFGRDTSMVFDSYYNINRNDTLAFIQWSSISNAGRVMGESYFGDMSWHCWDSQLLDVECPDRTNNQLESESD